MKKIITILLLISSFEASAQSSVFTQPSSTSPIQFDTRNNNGGFSTTNNSVPSCYTLTKKVRQQRYVGGSYISQSSFLNKIEFRQDSGGNIYAICSLNFREYIYCGISRQNMNLFNQYINTNQVGEAFHAYIKPYKCNCN